MGIPKHVDLIVLDQIRVVSPTQSHSMIWSLLVARLLALRGLLLCQRLCCRLLSPDTQKFNLLFTEEQLQDGAASNSSCEAVKCLPWMVATDLD